MRSTRRLLLSAFLVPSFVPPPSLAAVVDLSQGWFLQSSAKISEKGEAISRPEYPAGGWYVTAVPSTVFAALVANKVYPDPYFGMNLRSVPGVTYPVGTNFSNVAMAPDSPFRVAWWFRKRFESARKPGARAWLHFDGINFRANIWVNGRLIADSKAVAGAYRTYEFDITDLAAPGKPAAVALEISPPEPTDLGLNWVDWNPTPPDKNMGIWRDVYLTTSGPVTLRNPQVITKLDKPGLDKARLTVSAELHNAGDKPVKASLRGSLETGSFAHAVDLSPGETRVVTVDGQDCRCLDLEKPRLWWPVQMGAQHLYDLRLQVAAEGAISDEASLRFGIREVTSEFTPEKHTLFRVNGRPVLVRGGGWATDMMLRTSPEREVAEIRYVKDMNLNAIRFEGKTETRRFLEMCDREGILVIAGWCCCDHWERWAKWDEEDHAVSALSLRDQLKRIRNHPSILAWWYGSDNPPDRRTEAKYLEVLRECRWPNPFHSSATAKPAPVTGPTGLKMNGPYEWVPPHYWYVDTKGGGAFGFNTETSPGPAVPPIESLRRMIPADRIWPIGDDWNYHSGGGAFKTIQVFTEALESRMGKAAGAEDYARKAQVMAYESHRAMFEAFGRNKFVSTGVIQWMMNNAWPSLIWHLYDYYLRPGGSYFGAKRACEPVHIQYSYDDASVVVVNGTPNALSGLTASIRVLNADMTEKLAKKEIVDAPADSSRRVSTIPGIEGLTTAYFVRLDLIDSSGRPVSSNFYWLSTRPETLEDAKATWFYTPVRDFADLTALGSLPKAQLKASARVRTRAAATTATVELENPTRSLAFFVRLKLSRNKAGEEILPILWQDNYVSLLPGEKRVIAATFDSRLLSGAAPVLELEGMNVDAISIPVRR